MTDFFKKIKIWLMPLLYSSLALSQEEIDQSSLKLDDNSSIYFKRENDNIHPIGLYLKRNN